MGRLNESFVNISMFITTSYENNKGREEEEEEGRRS